MTEPHMMLRQVQDVQDLRARIQPSSRLLLPDLARGMALLGIAIANVLTAWSILGSNTGTLTALGNISLDPSQAQADKVAIIFASIVAHVRGLPLFSTLLGFGVGLLLMNQQYKGYTEKETRKLLLIRYAFLALFGAVHLVFLFFGDIMLNYACWVLIFLTFRMYRLKDKHLLYIAAGLYLSGFLVAVLTAFGPQISPDLQSVGESYLDYLQMNVSTLMFSPFIIGSAAGVVGPCMIVGYLAAKNNVLAQIDRYRKLLNLMTVITILICMTLGLQLGLATATESPSVNVLNAMNMVLGVLTGPGLLALLALTLDWCTRYQPRILNFLSPLSALGKRSMSGYVFQSLLFVWLFPDFGLGMASRTGAAGTCLIALGVWLLSVILSALLDAMGKPGPFEQVHRWLSYRKVKKQSALGAAETNRQLYRPIIPQAFESQTLKELPQGL